MVVAKICGKRETVLLGKQLESDEYQYHKNDLLIKRYGKREDIPAEEALQNATQWITERAPTIP